MFLKLFYKVEVKEWLNSLYEVIITLLSKADNNATKNEDYWQISLTNRLKIHNTEMVVLI